MAAQHRSSIFSSVAARLTLLLPLLGAAGCENNDPCVRREISCVDVLLVGGVSKEGDKLEYRDISITVRDNSDKDLVPPIKVALLQDTSEKDVGVPRRPSGAGVYGRVTIPLPASYNDLPDEELPMNLYPTDYCGATDPSTSDWSDSLDALRPIQKARRDKDPRAVKIKVSATEVRVDKNQSRPVGWDSRIDENLCYSPTQICNDNDGWGYFRLSKATHINAFAYLETPIDPAATTCPQSGAGL